MPRYSIQLSGRATKQLDKLPDKIAFKLLDAIEVLKENPRPSGCKKLKGRAGYRIRKGDYRIIYEIQDTILLIEVIEVGYRKDIYD